MLRRVAVLASLAVVAAMFVGSTTANADAGVCVFTGLAGNLTDDENGANGIDSIADDVQSGIGSHFGTDIEHGAYDYAGPASCAGEFGGHIITPAVNNATITSNGDYYNILCGTGWAIDAAGANTAVDLAAPGAPTITNVGYEIPFVAGNGPLFIGTGLPATAPVPGGATITGNYSGTGVVHITPDDDLDMQDGGDNCFTVDTNQFQVAGAFAITDP